MPLSQRTGRPAGSTSRRDVVEERQRRPAVGVQIESLEVVLADRVSWRRRGDIRFLSGAGPEHGEGSAPVGDALDRGGSDEFPELCTI
jgi:hypothetical protein